ncbi:MAG: pseudouridine synthase, partial [Atribacterota bacterium]
MSKIRLQKYLAKKGIDSRRKCEELIVNGRVKVNHQIVQKLGTKVDPIKDLVELDNTIISEKVDRIYILLNKPKGYLCTYSDPFGRPTIYNLLEGVNTKVNYAGRLDYLSEGLILLTNDGDLIYKVTHPKKKIRKVYLVKINGITKSKDIKKLEKGII